MDYYYADSANEARGPVSEEVLKNLFFQRRITLDSNVLLAGTSDWRELRDCFPDLEFYRGCPKCYQKVTVEDRTCPGCRFPIADYESNLSESRRRPIQRPQVNEAMIDAAIRADLSAYNSGCFLFGIVIFAIVLCFVPFIGLFLGGFTLLFGIVSFLSPVGLKLWWYRNSSSNEYAKLRQKAIDQLTSPFIGPCPKCNREITEHQGALATTSACPHCMSALQQQGSYIYFIPHIAAVLSNDYSALFPVEESA